jgi:hypothetical protein
MGCIDPEKIYSNAVCAVIAIEGCGFHSLKSLVSQIWNVVVDCNIKNHFQVT